MVRRTVASDPIRQCETRIARAGVEKGFRKARKRFSPGLVASRRIAGRQHHPVGVELQASNLARGQQAVVEVAWLLRQRESERRLAETLDIVGDQAVRREIHNPIAIEPGLLDGGLSCGLGEMNVGLVGDEAPGDGAQLIRRLGELRQAGAQGVEVGARALPEGTVVSRQSRGLRSR